MIKEDSWIMTQKNRSYIIKMLRVVKFLDYILTENSCLSDLI